MENKKSHWVADLDINKELHEARVKKVSEVYKKVAETGGDINTLKSVFDPVTSTMKYSWLSLKKPIETENK